MVCLSEILNSRAGSDIFAGRDIVLPMSILLFDSLNLRFLLTRRVSALRVMDFVET